MELHRGINFSRLEIPADAGGLIFMVGSVVALLIGIPPFRWFLLGAVVVGAAAAWALACWHLGHSAPPQPNVTALHGDFEQSRGTDPHRRR